MSDTAKNADLTKEEIETALQEDFGPQDEKRNGNKKATIIVLAVVLIALSVYCYFNIYKKP